MCSPSFSLYWNPALLDQLERLSTLILDCNNYTSHVKFPYMPSVTTVCINKNKINNLPVFVEEIRRKFPNIKWAWECFSLSGTVCVCRRHITSFFHCCSWFSIHFKSRILSMMNNEAAPSYFNGGSLTQYKDYRWASQPHKLKWRPTVCFCHYIVQTLHILCLLKCSRFHMPFSTI